MVTCVRPYRLRVLWMEVLLSANWSEDRITDSIYQAKFINVPDVICDWTAEYGGVAGKDILDFGCGEATMAVGMALRHGARRVVGVEIQPEVDNALPYARQQLGINRLPDNLNLVRIDADSDLGALGQFDLVYSWSVFEHVRQDLIGDCLAKIRRVLRPGGLMFLQTTPLYYSTFGSHLKSWIPQPWAHLLMQHDLLREKLRAAVEDDSRYAELINTYETLNRATDFQILDSARNAGFEIVRDYRTFNEEPIPESLLRVYQEPVLQTEQLVFLAKNTNEYSTEIGASGVEAS
jgi:2-polyprenyl-3-methyl-5-hydroxy-6-metoxy-1,4-benzoquinol methylase